MANVKNNHHIFVDGKEYPILKRFLAREHSVEEAQKARLLLVLISGTSVDQLRLLHA